MKKIFRDYTRHCTNATKLRVNNVLDRTTNIKSFMKFHANLAKYDESKLLSSYLALFCTIFCFVTLSNKTMPANGSRKIKTALEKKRSSLEIESIFLKHRKKNRSF